MKYNILFLIILIFFIGCTKSPDALLKSVPKTYLVKGSFDELPEYKKENYLVALDSFINSCKSEKTKKIYKDLCLRAEQASDPEIFLTNEFTPYEITMHNSKNNTLLTGYYEAHLNGSLVKKEPYVYPIYETPNDLVVIDLGAQYGELKNYRLRGRLTGNRVVPYYDREELHVKTLDANIICYTDSKVDLFFLEVQGSGRVTFENGETIFIGYDNQNGHKYSSIGKYLVQIGEISQEKISLQSIKEWFEKNPSRVDEVLNHNKSMVFFRQSRQEATGSLGLVLTPERSVAVDPSFIPLGSMLYLSAEINKKSVNRVVMAQDTGGAIKGSVRADMFLGFGDEAQEIAGELKSPLKLWILLPKNEIN
ncbi:murein transglycosylase A [Candidatus Sulfurimonas baltica]|uniref:peptidoglycan lytic exotransglycosylase n=1 Tax=Candidatus Sulfurimonas baltica TaxID=2740404 RepID=A0A7S7LWV9_9BACT|nr:MltA domain-containing protein [Candidatus Sulfurimonas baltica]QOY52880.1 MltA domain-containing protein [Candidatus Sulfurimonas baltica]